MTTSPSDIVVAYDASPGASSALAWAVHVARCEGRGVHAVVVQSAMDPVLSDFHARNVERAERQLARGRQELLESELAEAFVDVRTGPTAPVLMDAAADCSMLVVGRRPAGEGPPIGSVGLQLGRASRCPVVVVPPGEGTQTGHGVVVGVDGSPESREALDFACDHAAALGEPLVVVHAFHPRVSAGDDRVGRAHGGRGHHLRSHREVAEHRLADWTSEIIGQHPTLAVELRAVAGSAAKALVRQSVGASLLAVGCHRHDPVEQILLGSVSRYAIKHAACAVAVVHERCPA